MLGGQVQVIFSSVPGTIEYIRSGTLRPLAVTTATRSEALPDVPTLGDFVPGYEVTSWFGVGAPKNTRAPDAEGRHWLLHRQSARSATLRLRCGEPRPRLASGGICRHRETARPAEGRAERGRGKGFSTSPSLRPLADGEAVDTAPQVPRPPSHQPIANKWLST
jgi:Tripartite tricarboxylate transporter family receptor